MNSELLRFYQSRDHMVLSRSYWVNGLNHWLLNPHLSRYAVTDSTWAASENFKALLDARHANIYSRIPIERWIEVPADHLWYVHPNDNCGDLDNNLALGEGNIKWDKFFDALKQYGLKPRICLKVEASQNRSELENTKIDIEYLRKNKFCPF